VLSQQLLQKDDRQLKANGRAGGGGIPAEMYASLLLQLRQVTSESGPGPKLTAAARKERLKCQPCFQCPVCKKR
jgi:hypothetical protein